MCVCIFLTPHLPVTFHSTRAALPMHHLSEVTPCRTCWKQFIFLREGNPKSSTNQAIKTCVYIYIQKNERNIKLNYWLCFFGVCYNGKMMCDINVEGHNSKPERETAQYRNYPMIQ